MEWIQIYLFFVLQTHLPGYVDDFDKFKASNDSMNLFVFWSCNVFDYVQRCHAYVSQIKNYCTLYSLSVFLLAQKSLIVNFGNRCNLQSTLLLVIC